MPESSKIPFVIKLALELEGEIDLFPQGSSGMVQISRDRFNTIMEFSISRTLYSLSAIFRYYLGLLEFCLRSFFRHFLIKIFRT